MDTNPLAKLKTIHLPKPISIFPLAIGWYILGIIILMLIGLVIWWVVYKRKRQEQIRQIYQILDKIEQQSMAIDGNEVISEISILLKRVARMHFAEQKPHLLFGEAWLIFLDNTGKTTQFTNGAGRSLLSVYQEEQHKDYSDLFVLVKQWLKVVI